MLIFSFIILFWVSTRHFFYALMRKKRSSLIQEHCIPHQSDTLCFTSCLFKLPKTQPALIGQLTHA